MKRHIIKTTSHEDWLEARSHGIGSSDIGTILGLNRFETPYQLWLKKTNQMPPTEENEAMLMGHLLEDAVAQRWAIATGHTIIKESANEWLYIHPDVDYFRASPDRIYWRKGDTHNEANKCILECKTTVLDVDVDNLPKTWFCQVQWLMHCTGYKHASLAWIKLDHRQFGYKDIEYDPNFCAWLAEEATKFWCECVIGGNEPPLRNLQDIVTKYANHVKGKTLNADEVKCVVGNDEMTLAKAVQRLIQIKDTIAEQEQYKDEIEEALKTVMCDAEAIVKDVRGTLKPIVTWRTSKPSTKFDSKAFEKDNPELAQPYVKTVAGTRRFIVKSIK